MLKNLTSINTIAIIRVNNENQTLGILVIMSPERTNLVLSSDIPHGETNILVLNSLDIEAYTIC